ncbi:SDR family NAD(P)-dependent oxidoreductase [Castellaniella sp.]|uniref:SDR family NAD(P)-dependent oxidoreductase n=1 Tax=Castellaniella sp. TaxID=1955812 RepID=UPI00355E1A43
MSENLLSGKVAVVTGAGGGIGHAIALELVAQGARVVVNDMAVEAAEKVVAEITALHGPDRAVALVASVADPEAAAGIVQCAVDTWGHIDLVVNNAGNLRDRWFHKLSVAEWQQVIDVHLNGSFHVSRAAAPFFREQQSGSFVHMTSTSGLIGNFGQANYSAAKAGIIGLSKSIALDMQASGVRSNCIAPFAWTAMTQSIPARTPEEQARVEKLKKMEPGKIAPLVAYLGSDLASDVTGQIFAVRANEIMLFSQPRPLRSVHLSEGWSAARVAEVAIPALRSHFYPLERSPDVISWDPI